MVDVREIKVGSTVRFNNGESVTVTEVNYESGCKYPLQLYFNDNNTEVTSGCWWTDEGVLCVNKDVYIVSVFPPEESNTPKEGIESTLEERGKRYGTFEDNGEIAQSLKDVLTRGREWDNMPLHHKEALHMICSKMSRIVTADFSYDDNYRDIIGYATLILNELEK
jgi:hypothetical protein